MILTDGAAVISRDLEAPLRVAVEEALAGPVKFRFNPVLENQFERMTWGPRVRAMRRFLIIIAAIMTGCLAIDAQAGTLRLGICVRLLIEVPLLLSAAYIIGRTIPVWAQGFCIGIPVVVVTAGTTFVTAAMSSFYQSQYVMGAGLFMIAVNTVIPLRFRHARVISAVSLLAFAIIVLRNAGPVSGGSSLYFVIFTTVLVTFTLMVTHRSEETQRQAFLLAVRDRLSSQELSRANEQLLMLSQTDALTAVFNRRFFDTAVNQARDESLRDGTSVALLMIDVDCFKLLNDLLGHAEGDACLQRIARAIRDHVRAEDLVSRYGGEEFVVILPAATPLEAMAVAERVRAAVESLRCDASMNGRIVTVSIGVAALAAEAQATVADLVRAADAALYDAKRAGRNLVISAATPFVPAG